MQFNIITCAARVVVKAMADPRVDRRQWFDNDWLVTSRRLENEGIKKNRENRRRRFVSTLGNVKFIILKTK